MKPFVFCLCLLSLLFISCTPKEEDNSEPEKEKTTMEHPEYGKFEFLVVTEGIVGGFAPAQVRWKLILDMHDGHYCAHIMKLDQDGKEVYVEGNLDKEKTEKLLTDLHSIFTLPVEDPVGSEDIYRMDTSLHLHFSKKFWVNRAPAARHGQSTVQVEDKHMEVFGKAGLAIRELVEKSELKPCSKEDFEKILTKHKPFSYRIGQY